MGYWEIAAPTRQKFRTKLSVCCDDYIFTEKTASDLAGIVSSHLSRETKFAYCLILKTKLVARDSMHSCRSDQVYYCSWVSHRMSSSGHW